MTQALYRKWRPLTFDDVQGQGHITETLKTQIQKERVSHAYIFTGSRGTGKTSCAKILSRAVNCLSPENGNPCNKCVSCRGILDGGVMDVVEIDAASNNGVDNVRALRDEAIYAPASVRMRVYIIDEVHMLSNQAWAALLKILEEPPAHLLFILATTELHKVPLTITSRCQRFSFKRLHTPDIERRLRVVAENEKLSIDGEALRLLARLADGSMRDALSILDQCAMVTDELTVSEMRGILGLAGGGQSMELVSAIVKNDAGAALGLLSELYMDGKDLAALLDELSSVFRDLLILKTAPKSGISLLNSVADNEELIGLGQGFTAARLISGVSLIGEALGHMQRGGGKMAAELCLLRLCDESLCGSLAGMEERVARLEAGLSGAMPSVIKTSVAKEQTAFTAAATPNIPEAARHGKTPDTASRETEKSVPKADKSRAADKDSVTTLPVAEGGGDAGKWAEILSLTRDKISVPEFMSLSNPALTRIGFKDGVLTVILDNKFTKDLLNKAHVLESLKEAAAGVYGGATAVALALAGDAPAGASLKSDKLDDLIAFGGEFGNIVIK